MFVEESIKKPIDVKWVYNMKQRPTDEISKNKARLIARVFLQKPGIDFDDVYAPVAGPETIRIIVSAVTYKGWNIHHLDVKSPFFEWTF